MITPFYLHSLLMDGVRVGGVQSSNITKSIDHTIIRKWGGPITTENIEKQPTVNLNFTKFLSDDYGPLFSGFDIRNRLYQVPPEKYDFDMLIDQGIGSINMKDMVLAGISFSFKTEGFFSEDLSFLGHVMSPTNLDFSVGESSAMSIFPLSDIGPHPSLNYDGSWEGVTFRRKDYNKALDLPTEIGTARLLSVTPSISINYNIIANYGGFLTYRNKYMTTPVDITCTYEFYDVGYSQSRMDYIGEVLNDVVQDQGIIVGTSSIEIDLGEENFLSSKDRSGGDAGESNYSVYKYTYKNTNNYFTIS